MPAAPDPPSSWPGRRLGLPEAGRGSIARLSRRVPALAIDWGLSVLISIAFFGYDSLATLLIFVVTQTIFVLTAGSSIGHLVFGLRVVGVTGGPIGVWRPSARALLIAIVVPAVIWDSDQRGMHDRLIGTVLVRR